MTISRGRLFGPTILVFVIILGFIGYNGYNYIFNGLNVREQQEIADGVSQITQDIIQGISTQEDLKKPENEEDGLLPAPEESSAVQAQQPSPDSEKIPEIQATYQAGLFALQQESNAMLDELLGSIKAEYIVLKESGADKTAFIKLALSYIEKANAMEAEIDSGFQLIISNMEAELLTAGMAQDAIQAYAADLNITYKNQKSERRNGIMDKAKEYL